MKKLFLLSIVVMGLTFSMNLSAIFWNDMLDAQNCTTMATGEAASSDQFANVWGAINDPSNTRSEQK